MGHVTHINECRHTCEGVIGADVNESSVQKSPTYPQKSPIYPQKPPHGHRQSRHTCEGVIGADYFYSVYCAKVYKVYMQS